MSNDAPETKPAKTGDVMQLERLMLIIQRAGGQCFALEYAAALMVKIARIENDNGYGKLIDQLCAAREQGDFRGRLLEVNFANHFIEKGIKLQYGATQGMSGDIDFCWVFGNYQVFIEMKLLGQDMRTKDRINKQLNATGSSEILITDDTWDVARIQRDIFQKSSTKKFNPNLEPSWINLVAIDVSELQLGAVDFDDCLLAALGNEVASKFCHPFSLRPKIVGVFEQQDPSRLSDEQREWVNHNHLILLDEPHPRSYIHGVMFLFRDPKERAALSYELSAAVVWNPALWDVKKTSEFTRLFHGIVPCMKKA